MEKKFCGSCGKLASDGIHTCSPHSAVAEVESLRAEVERLEAELAKIKQATQWKPIETAPKDKRLVVWSGQEIYCAHWVKNPFTEDEAWLVCDLGDGNQALVKPTHYWNHSPEPLKTPEK